MSKQDTVKKLNRLMQYAFTYQLAVSGPFSVSNTNSETSISNDEFSKFGLRFISSNRLDYDGGIEVNFLSINKFGLNMLKLLGHNSITVNLYNLESTDGEYDLEIFHIDSVSDCERIHVSLNLSDFSDEVIDQFSTVIDSHINSDAVSKLRTYAALLQK
jgi:hypothetical protein